VLGERGFDASTSSFTSGLQVNLLTFTALQSDDCPGQNVMATETSGALWTIGLRGIRKREW